jgi:hypothetical protein
VLLGALLAAPLVAQSPAPGATFEAADVRAAAPNPAPHGMHGGILRGNRYEIRNATMLDLIRTAYSVDGEEVVGGPSWLELHRFDITALAPSKTPPATLRAMLRSVLVDRFKAVIRAGPAAGERQSGRLPGECPAAGERQRPAARSLHEHDDEPSSSSVRCCRPVGAYVLTADNPKLRQVNPSSRTRRAGTAATGPNPGTRRSALRNPILKVSLAEPGAAGRY